MGMYDTFLIKSKCPYCGNKDIFDFQTKSLINCLITWKQGQKFDKFKRKIRKYAWCPDIKDGIIYGGLTDCKSEKCINWEIKKVGYNSGTGRMFRGDIVIKNGIVKDVINIRKDR